MTVETPDKKGQVKTVSIKWEFGMEKGHLAVVSVKISSTL